MKKHSSGPGKLSKGSFGKHSEHLQFSPSPLLPELRNLWVLIETFVHQNDGHSIDFYCLVHGRLSIKELRGWPARLGSYWVWHVLVSRGERLRHMCVGGGGGGRLNIEYGLYGRARSKHKDFAKECMER